MDVSVLMVNDWVHVGSSMTRQITVVSDKYVGYEGIVGCVPYDSITPILITANIFELNGVDGYKSGVNGKCRCYPNSMGEYFQFEYTFDKKVMLSMSFEYVHELQHALRFCGLDELADNFKVE